MIHGNAAATSAKLDKVAMARARAVAGIYDHAGWAVLVCVANGEVLDRRQIELVEPGLPNLPHHHEGQMLPITPHTCICGK